MTVFISEIFPGSKSDEEGDRWLADKGFIVQKILDNYGVIVQTPVKLSGKMQFTPEVYKTWTGVHGPRAPHGPGPRTTPWTTPNLQQEIAPVNIKIYLRSGYEQKHRLIFIAYVLEGLSHNSGLAG